VFKIIDKKRIYKKVILLIFAERGEFLYKYSS